MGKGDVQISSSHSHCETKEDSTARRTGTTRHLLHVAYSTSLFLSSFTISFPLIISRLPLPKASLDATLSLLKAAQDTLSNAEKRISLLEASFAEASAKREQLANDVEKCRVRLVRAQSLMGGLASEKVRWTDTYKSLSSAYDNLVGDVLVSAGSIGKSSCYLILFPHF